MRAVLLGLAGLLALSVPAYAKTSPVPPVKFKVLLKVVKKPCLVQAPATVSIDASGVPLLRLASLLPDCDLDGVPATLTVRVNPAEKGTDVATINF